MNKYLSVCLILTLLFTMSSCLENNGNDALENESDYIVYNKPLKNEVVNPVDIVYDETVSYFPVSFNYILKSYIEGPHDDFNRIIYTGTKKECKSIVEKRDNSQYVVYTISRFIIDNIIFASGDCLNYKIGDEIFMFELYGYLDDELIIPDVYITSNNQFKINTQITKVDCQYLIIGTFFSGTQIYYKTNMLTVPDNLYISFINTYEISENIYKELSNKKNCSFIENNQLQANELIYGNLKTDQ